MRMLRINLAKVKQFDEEMKLNNFQFSLTDLFQIHFKGADDDMVVQFAA